MGRNGYPLQKVRRTSCFIVFYWWLMVEWTFGFKTKCLPPGFSSWERSLQNGSTKTFEKNVFLETSPKMWHSKSFVSSPFRFVAKKAHVDPKNVCVFGDGIDLVRWAYVGVLQTLNETANIFASPMLRFFHQASTQQHVKIFGALTAWLDRGRPVLVAEHSGRKVVVAVDGAGVATQYLVGRGTARRAGHQTPLLRLFSSSGRGPTGHQVMEHAGRIRRRRGQVY